MFLSTIFFILEINQQIKNVGSLMLSNSQEWNRKKMLELSVQVLFFMELWEGAFSNTYNYKTT